MSEKRGLDRQMLYIRDRAAFHKLIDEMGDDGIAILLTRSRLEGDGQLGISSYGEGQETEFLGLLGYGTALLHRQYFIEEDDEDE